MGYPGTRKAMELMKQSGGGGGGGGAGVDVDEKFDRSWVAIGRHRQTWCKSSLWVFRDFD